MTTEKFPSIKDLVLESFDLFKKSLKQFILLFLAFIGLFLLFFLLGALLVLIGFLLFSNLHNLSLIIGLISAVVLIAAFVIYLAGTGAFSASILMILDKPNTYSLKEVIRKSFKLGLTIIGLSLLTSFLILPFFIYLLIPGIILSILLAFAPYELVLKGNGVLNSLGRSLYVVKSNFLPILVRMIILFLISFVLTLLVSNVAQMLFKNALSVVITLPFNLLLSAYCAAYSMVLYKQADKAVSDKKKVSQLKWLVIFSLISYVVAAFLMIKITDAIFSNPQIMNFIKQGVQASSGKTASQDELFKSVFKTGFVDSCVKSSQGDNSKYCTCFADYLLKNNTSIQLQEMTKKYSENKVMPAQFTKAASYCTPK